MKIKKIALLIPAMVFGLFACDNQQTSSTGGGINSDASGESSSNSPSSVAKKYAITLNAAEGTTINLVTAADESGKYEAGSTVKFTVTNEPSVAVKKVTANGKEVLSGVDGYEFTMLNQDVTLATETISLGSSDIVNVSDVDEKNLPTTAAAVKDLLVASKEKEKIFLKSATYESTFDDGLQYDGEVGINQVVHLNEYKNKSTDKLTSYTLNEYGLYDEDKFYSIQESKSSSNSADYSTQGTMQRVVSNDIEEVNKIEIKSSDANTNVTTLGLVYKLVEKAYSNSLSSFANTNSDEGWNDIKVSSVVDTSKKFYTITMSATYKDKFNSTFQVGRLNAVVDGDSFVNSVLFTQDDYKSADWDSQNCKPQDGATPKTTKHISVSQVRGYRNILDKKDLSRYVMHDYDVEFSYFFPEISSYTTYDAENNKNVASSSQLNYKLRQKNSNPIAFMPMVVGSKEEGFIEFDSDGNPRIAKIGDFHVVFDNGLGELKELKLTSFTPDPIKINATFDGDSKIFKGESKILKVEVLPSAANQNVTVTLDESSSCQAEITSNNDGTWNIKGTNDGLGKLNVVAENFADVKTSVNFTVETKPDAQKVQTFLTSTTLVGSITYYGKHFFNFNVAENGDRTGQYVCYEENEKGNVLDFTWEFNSEAMTLMITLKDVSLNSLQYVPVRFDNLKEDVVDLYISYRGGSEKGPAKLKASSQKLDFSTVSAETLKDYK